MGLLREPEPIRKGAGSGSSPQTDTTESTGEDPYEGGALLETYADGPRPEDDYETGSDAEDAYVPMGALEPEN